MLARFYRKRAVGHVLLNFILVLILILSTATTVLASGDDGLSQIRLLLKNQYVDPVSADVLKAPTIDETLERLGDPHTMYFSPAEYQDFLGSIDMRFSGIGIHIDMVTEGVNVVSVVSGSPAEEVGLKTGDVIIRADGKSLAGLSAEDAVSLLRGLEGSSVQIRVKQGEETRNLSVTRREISEPTVTGEVLNGHIGYLDLKSFGIDTPTEFETALNRLRNQNVDSWIVDLRDNGGGYLSSAMDLAGYFIGEDVAVQIKDRTGISDQYKALDHGFTLSQPVIFLTNENSASASEILTAAVKDHHKAIIVGTTTYGKGSVQSMFPLSNGGVLKMTIAHFYSPLGHEIDKVGISPDVVIQQADPLKAAELILSDTAVAQTLGRTMDYWTAWGEVLNSRSASATENLESYSFYYPGYHKVSELSEISLDKKFNVHFVGLVDWQSVNNNSIELINSKTGERTLATFKTLGQSDLAVIPQVTLTPNTTYWLVMHPTIKGVSGEVLNEGTLAVVHTIQGAEAQDTMSIQSLRNNDQVSERKAKSPRDPDYGNAIMT
ncbi:MAG TPA: S41 family peptidase [Desulfosporosinus sp.]|nr:S41 family peptidase [Desulfosporosinus sp.]